MSKSPVALITGASKGIGAAIARVLAKDGFDIWLNFHTDTDAASRVAADIHQLGRKCELLPFDVTDKQKCRETLFPYLEESVPYALINNAGFSRDSLLVWMEEKNWKEVLQVNLDGFYNVTKPVLERMLRKKQGRIINIASTSGQTGVPGQVNYSAAKSGIIGATRSLAAEVAKRNVLVNAVAPGFIDTEMLSGLPRDEVVSKIPLRRLGKPEEVAGAVAFLCSDRASYITGEIISVNGGIHS